MPSQYEREEEQLSRDFADGFITAAEFNAQMRELQRWARDEARAAAEQAYQDAMERWWDAMERW